MPDATTVLSAELSANPQPLIEGFKRAEQATGAWADAAKRHMNTAQASFGDLKFDVVTTKAKAEQIKLIELQHQLDVARAAGETKTVAALTREIDLLQTIRRLRSAGLNDNDATHAARGAAEAVAAAREAAELREATAKRRERSIGNPGEALSSAFGRVRLGVLEEGGTKLPVFGSSLEALGAAGLGTAAALAAVAVAGEEARKSLEFADEVDRTSKSLGISTTQLQQYDFAFSGSAVGVAKGREALASFNEVFGKYSSGLASARQGKFFQALGITPESARDLSSTQEALEKTLSSLAKIQNPQQRAALATQLGLKDFLVVLSEGQEGVDKFVASMQSAQGAGAVISPEEIRKAAELNDKLEQVEHTVGIELKKAFIELGPALLSVAELVERVAKGGAALANSISNILAGIGALQNTADKQANRDFFRDVGQAGSYLLHNTTIGRGALALADGAHDLAQNGRAARLRSSVGDALSGRVDFSAYGLGERPKSLNLAPPAKEKKGPEDQTGSYDKAAVDAYQSALKAAATATAALTGDIQAHADLEKQAVDDDLTKKLADLSKQEADIRKAKLDTHRREQLALIDKAKTEEQNAAAAKKEKIDRDAEEALRQRALQDARDDDNVVARGRTARAAVTPGKEGRADAELQNFKDQQLSDYAARQDDLNARLKRDDGTGGDLSQDQIDAKLAALRATQQDELVARRDSVLRSADPLRDLAHPLTSVNDDLRSAEADGVKALGDGLQAVVTGTKDVKTAFSDMAKSIIADLLRIAIQREIEQPLANFLPGGQGGNINATGGSASVGALGGGFLSGVLSLLPKFADGGVVGGIGGPRSDNILARLSPGEVVIPNGALSPRVPQRSSGSTVLNINVDAGGAFSFEHVADVVEASGHRVLAAAGLQLAGVTRRQSQSSRQDLTRF